MTIKLEERNQTGNIDCAEFARLMKVLAAVADAVGRTMAFASAPIAFR